MKKFIRTDCEPQTPIYVEAMQYDGTNACEIIKFTKCTKGYIKDIASQGALVLEFEGRGVTSIVLKITNWVVEYPDAPGRFYPLADMLFKSKFIPSGSPLHEARYADSK